MRTFLIVATVVLFGQSAVAQTGKYNVLFVAVDDLRPSFGAYGGPIKTPNLDRLAKEGTLFLNAHCQQAVCSPSRSSLLTGQRPDTTKVYDLVTHFRTAIPDAVTLPQYFKNNGYDTRAVGKIYHPGYNDAPSWSIPQVGTGGFAYSKAATDDMQKRKADAKAAGKTAAQLKSIRGPAVENDDRPDADYPDGIAANKAIEWLREYAKTPDQRYFLAVGFHKPHLPFVSPKKYWDLYKSEDIVIPENFGYPPTDVPAIALHTFGELRAYADMPKQGPVSRDQARRLIHGYYAAASFMDAQLGKLLDELDRTGQRKNTIIVLWGDHGWFLGEYGLWCKHSNFEWTTHAPLIFSMPGQKAAGGKVAGMAEFVDVYPTLADACGLSIPTGLPGISVRPCFDNPKAATKPAAFSQYPRGKTMGYTMRTDRWRYTEWGKEGVELYDHQADPGETVNLAKKPEHAKTVAELAEQLHTAMPKSNPG